MMIEVFTGVVLLDNYQRVYLLKEEDKNQISQDRWNLPGGSVDFNEGLIDSAKRETLEETGYGSEINSVLGVYQGSKGDKSWLYVVFQAEVKNKRKAKLTDHSVKRGRWFEKEEFLKMDDSLMVHPEMKTVYQLAVKKSGLSLDTVRFVNYD